MSIFPAAPRSAAGYQDESGAGSAAPPLSRAAALCGALVAFTAVFTAGCSRGKSGEARAAEPPPAPAGAVSLAPAQLSFVSVEPVGVRAERPVATVPAQIVYDEDHTARVYSPVTGRVDRLDARLGDLVARGAPLAHLLSSDVAQAGADLAKAEAAGRQSAASLARERDLYAHGVVAQKELQQAESDAASAGAEQERASLRARLLGASGAGQTFVLRAPLAGEVLDRQVNPGTEVQPGGTTPLFTISDLRDVWLTANLYQRDLAAVRRGARVVFTSDALGTGPGSAVEARVTYLADVLDPQTRTAAMRAVVPNPGHRLRPSAFGQATVYASDDAHTPVVPSAALVTRGGGTVVYVEDSPGHYRRREVTVGEDDGSQATITRGLRPGERVVAKGSLLVDAQAERQATSGQAAGGAAQGGESGA